MNLQHKLKVGDYSTAERACGEFVLSNPEDELAGSNNIGMQKLSIRQLYTDTTRLEGYQNIQKERKSNKFIKTWSFNGSNW